MLWISQRVVLRGSRLWVGSGSGACGVVLPCSAHDHRSHDDSKVATLARPGSKCHQPLLTRNFEYERDERVWQVLSWGAGGFSALQKTTFDFVEKGVAPSDAWLPPDCELKSRIWPQLEYWNILEQSMEVETYATCKRCSSAQELQHQATTADSW